MSGIPEITQPAASGVAVPRADGDLSTFIQSFSGLSVVRHNVSPDVGMGRSAEWPHAPPVHPCCWWSTESASPAGTRRRSSA